MAVETKFWKEVSFLLRFHFCPHCGQPLAERDLGDDVAIPFCNSCSRPWFDSFATCIILLAINELGEVALIRQSYPPDYKNPPPNDKFVCVAGFLKPGESAEDGAIRELHEELGLPALSVQFVHSFPLPERDQLMLGFVCRVQKTDFQLSNEVCQARWFSGEEALEYLSRSRIARLLLEQYLSSMPNAND